MKLKDICDMTEYLAERCYCPGEIYDSTGFFFQNFDPEEECRLLVRGQSHDDENVQAMVVICRDQLIVFWYQDNTIFDSVRFDATENNMKQLKEYYHGDRKEVDMDEFEDGSTARNLEEVLAHADAILVSH